MLRRHGPLVLLFTLTCGLLAACGSQATAPAAAPSPPATTSAATIVAPAPPTVAVLAPTELPTVVAVVAPTNVAGVNADGPYAGLAQGRTAEGYHLLGAADAPVTLVMYSDFL
jgi:ABC-type Fe3+-hydroxamate transport system substrate-binding protein